MNDRFEMRVDPFWRPLIVPFGGTDARSYAEITDENQLHVRFGFLFDHAFALASIDRVATARPPWWVGVGWHTNFVGAIRLLGSHDGCVEIHLREPAISRLTITYSGYTFGSSELVEWTSPATQVGWGFEPFGFFPWGDEDAIDIKFGTQPAPVIRTYVPRFQQRSTFIQPILEHREAGEPLNIQGICYAVRAYMERVTK